MSNVLANRRELRLLIARHGFDAGTGSTADSRPPSHRLAELLAELGPVGCRFASYIASRVDLLSRTDRAPFSALSQSQSAEPPAIKKLLELSLGDRLSQLATVDPLPEAADWAGSWYRAQGADGRALRLYLMRPDIEIEVDETMVALRALAPILSRAPWDLRAEAVLADFRIAALEPRLDLERHGKILDRLTRHTNPGLMMPPRVPELCGAHVLTVEEPEGCRGLLAGGPLSSRGPKAARDLCQAWLRLNSVHSLIAHDLHLGRLEDETTVWLGGTFTEHSDTFKKRLNTFFHAAASQSPEQVLEAWHDEVATADIDLKQIHSRLRQVTPQRSGPWRDETPGTGGESATEYAIAYWQESGLELSTPWRIALGAFEGLGHRAAVLDADGDPLAEAIWQIEWDQGFRRLRNMSNPAELVPLIDRYTTALLELPPNLDRWLNREPGEAQQLLSTPDHRRSSSRTTTCLALLIAMVCVGALVRSFSDLAFMEAGGSVLFILLGATLLKTVAS